MIENGWIYPWRSWDKLPKLQQRDLHAEKIINYLWSLLVDVETVWVVENQSDLHQFIKRSTYSLWVSKWNDCILFKGI